MAKGGNSFLGRVVRFYEGDRVMAAVVTKDQGGGVVNLSIFTPEGDKVFGKTGVQYGDKNNTEQGSFWSA